MPTPADIGTAGQPPFRRAVCFLKSARRNLVLRNLAVRIERTVGQPVRAALARPVIRNKNGVGPDRFYDHGLHGDFAATSGDGNPVAFVYAVSGGQPGLISTLGAGY